eukprot:Polyplicarium_translucidae@DN3597_c0_g1_i1.p5
MMNFYRPAVKEKSDREFSLPAGVRRSFSGGRCSSDNEPKKKRSKQSIAGQFKKRFKLAGRMERNQDAEKKKEGATGGSIADQFSQRFKLEERRREKRERRRKRGPR